MGGVVSAITSFIFHPVTQFIAVTFRAFFIASCETPTRTELNTTARPVIERADNPENAGCYLAANIEGEHLERRKNDLANKLSRNDLQNCQNFLNSRAS